MGMLASVIGSLADAGAEYAGTMAKISANKEAEEIKKQNEIDKELRIQEAKIAEEKRANERADTVYQRNLNDQRTDAILKSNDELETFGKKQGMLNSWASNPTNPEYQKSQASIRASDASAGASSANAAKTEAETKNLKIISDLQDIVATSDDPAEVMKASDKLEAIRASTSSEARLKEIDQKTYDETDGKFKNTRTIYDSRKEKVIEAPIKILKKPEESLTHDDAVKKATEAANDAIGGMEKPSSVGMINWKSDEEKAEIAKKRELWDATYSKTMQELQNPPKEEPKSKADSESESSNSKDDSDLKKSILRKAIIGGESSGKADAQNPDSSAGGYGQMIDSTALAYGAKPDANGKLSYEEKNKAWEKFFNSNYDRFDGDPLKIATAQFGQDAVAKAQADAKKDNSDWRKHLTGISQQNKDYVNNVFMPNMIKMANEKGVRITADMLKRI